MLEFAISLDPERVTFFKTCITQPIDNVLSPISVVSLISASLRLVLIS